MDAALLSGPDLKRAEYLAYIIGRQVRLRNKLLWQLGFAPVTLVRPSAEELVNLIDQALRSEVSTLVARKGLEAAIQTTTEALQHQTDAFGLGGDQP